MTAKWKRIRPGLYHLKAPNGDVLALVERGAETGMWWWEAYEPMDLGIMSAGHTGLLLWAKQYASAAAGVTS
jgi:hypothetical protein